MSIINNKIVGMGKALGAGGDGDLQRIFRTSTGNKS